MIIIIIIRLHLQDIFIPVSYLLIPGCGNLIRDVSTGDASSRSGWHRGVPSWILGVPMREMRVVEAVVTLKVGIEGFFCGNRVFVRCFRSGNWGDIGLGCFRGRCILPPWSWNRRLKSMEYCVYL